MDVPICGSCGRERTLQDPYDYNPIQVLTGVPLGWYSGGDGEICPQCMTELMSMRGNTRMTENTPVPVTSTSDPHDPHFLERVADHQRLALGDIPAAGGQNSPEGKAILNARLALQREDVPRLLAGLAKAREYIDGLFWVAYQLDQHDDDAGEPLRIAANDLEDLLELPHRQWGSVEAAQAEAFAMGDSGLAHAFDYHLGPQTVVKRALNLEAMAKILGEHPSAGYDDATDLFKCVCGQLFTGSAHEFAEHRAAKLRAGLLGEA